MPDQKTMWTRCLGGFSVMWVTKLLISPVKKRIFCPKTTKFGPKLAFLAIAVSFGALLVGWMVVVALAVSRKTPIYFIIKIIAEQRWKTCAANEEQRYHDDNDDHIGGLLEGRAVKTAAGRLWYTVHSLLLVYLLASTTPLLRQLSIRSINQLFFHLYFISSRILFFNINPNWNR